MQVLSNVFTAGLKIDRWLASSLLQKAIRRGESEVAQSAALALFELSGAAIWRRLILIAFEDIGAASVDALSEVVLTRVNRVSKTKSEGDCQTVVDLTVLLSESPKSRSTEHLMTA